MRKFVKMVCVGTLLSGVLLLMGFFGRIDLQDGCAFARERLKVATTTSLYDTGLWGAIEPLFKEKFDVELDIVYAGTGIAIEYGKRADVDVLTIHDRVREDAFIEEGYGVNRRCFAYNYFVLVGPEIDPAGIRNMVPEEAFQKLMMEGQTNPERVRFVSRGDGSGTHAREKAVWSSAGHAYSGVQESGSWYVEAGRGMGPTLLMASEMQAYTLSDIGTFLAFAGDLEIVSLVAEGEVLLNVYAVLSTNPEKHAWVDIHMANNLINFLISDEVQEIIANFGVEEYGVPLFYPAGGGKCKDMGCPTWEECAKIVE